jgi:hypothetical protein
MIHAGGKGEAVWLVAADGLPPPMHMQAPFAKVIVEPFEIFG